MRVVPCILAAAWFVAATSSIAAQQADVVITGGTVYDGSGNAPRLTDIAIRGDRIVLIGDARQWTSRHTIDARGLIVSPGFIDPHIHAEGDLRSANRATRQAAFALMQGVTTVVTGNDGGGPIAIGETLAALRRDSIGPNAALLVGHGRVRGIVLGMTDRAPTTVELISMKALVDSAMRGGAFGLSSGLYYAPGSYATTNEVVELALVAASYGGIYDSHTRDESSYTIGLVASVAEAIDVGRRARIPVNISHIKALGVDVWGQAPAVIALIKRAQAEGITVTADQYPWTASGTSISASLLPRWAEAGGRDSLLARLDTPALHARIAAEMRENMRRRGGASTLLMTSVSGPATLRTAASGKTLAEYATAVGSNPIDAAIGIIRAGGASVASFNMNEADIEAFMQEPFVMTGSDGSGGHPRKFGTYPRKIRRYVLDKPVISMERMIQASSAQVAETFKISQRGYLREGYFADVTVFDPRTIRDLATYEEPTLLAEGIRWVVVNGVVAVSEGKLTNALPGRALSRREP